jgi:hypothetical protein
MKIPSQILEKFEQAIIGLDYGTVTLSLSIKEGKHRYIITREESIIPSIDPINKIEMTACSVEKSMRKN